jgi:hypothetical protein
MDAGKHIDNRLDIIESVLWVQYPEILEQLLRDHTTHQNIIWATDDYRENGEAFDAHAQILPELITGQYETTVMPRVKKERALQTQRVRDMAEVFTPTWVCNCQNNLIDEAWFGRKAVFNTEYIAADGRHNWCGTEGIIEFSEAPSRESKHSWQDYVRDLRLEVTCGEAPYLASRYDRVTGEVLSDLRQRVGILDRKLRVVSENTQTTGDWIQWAKEALMATYAYEWQGDNLLLAREALFYTILDYYKDKFGEYPSGVQKQSLPGFAYIISWNLWQMDGLKMVVPYSCEGQYETDLFGESKLRHCTACENGRYTDHIGTHCIIRDWRKPREKQKIEFQSLFGGVGK